MFIRTPGVTSTLLSFGALLAVSAGCSSAQSTPTRMDDSRRDTTFAASQQETRYSQQQNRSQHRNGDRTMHESPAISQVRPDSAFPDNDDRSARVADTSPETARHNRATAVSAEKPPLTLVETPSRTPTDNEFWIGGHWLADASGFSWQAGRIEHDRPGALFVPAAWNVSPRGWELTPEYWR